MSLAVNRSIKSPGVFNLAISGSLDANTSSTLEAEANQLLNDSTRGLIFDFEFLDFISSAGLRVVIMAQKEMKKRGGALMMLNLKPQIRKVFEIIKALPDAKVFSSVEELDSYLSLMQEKYRE